MFDWRRFPLKCITISALLVGLSSIPAILSASPSNTSQEAHRPKRIVSVTLGSDEILLDILTRCKGLDRLVAISTLATDLKYSNVTNEAKIIKGRVGSNVEEILQFKPDLVVVAAYNRPEFLRRIREAKIPVVELGQFSSLADITLNVKILAEAVDCKVQGQEIVAEFEGRLNLLVQSIPRRPKPVSILGFGTGGMIIGKETTFDSVLTTIQGENLATKLNLTGWAKVDPEVIAGLKPDFIVAGGSEGEKAKILSEMESLPGWKLIPAVRDKKVLLVPEAELSAVSPHIIRAIDRIAKGMQVTGNK